MIGFWCLLLSRLSALFVAHFVTILGRSDRAGGHGHSCRDRFNAGLPQSGCRLLFLAAYGFALSLVIFCRSELIIYIPV
jgi:hypothetical protein